MALTDSDEIVGVRIELSETVTSLRSSYRSVPSRFHSHSTQNSFKDDFDDELPLQWAAIDRLPTFKRVTSSLFDENIDGDEVGVRGKRVVDVTELGGPERHLFIEKLIKNIESDNLRLLQKLRKRMDKAGVKLPTVEVRYRNLYVEMECEVVHGKALPTLWNSLMGSLSDIARVLGLKSKLAKIKIINEVSGIIKPGRLTLLLGPPGCGKTSLLKALSGNLDTTLKRNGYPQYSLCLNRPPPPPASRYHESKSTKPNNPSHHHSGHIHRANHIFQTQISTMGHESRLSC